MRLLSVHMEFACGAVCNYYVVILIPLFDIVPMPVRYMSIVYVLLLFDRIK